MSDNFAEIMLKALRLRFRYCVDSLEAVRENPSCKNTHSLSTSIRRILTCDRIVRDLLGKSLLNKKVEQPIKRLRKILSHTRDAQEMPLKFKEISGPENRWRKVGFKLEKHEKQMVQKLSSAVEKFREDLLKKAFSRKRLGRICEEKLKVQPVDYVKKQFAQTLEHLPQALDGMDNHALHKLRISYKYFRYSVEALASVLGFDEKDLDWLREFQTTLGDAHDWMVLGEFVGEATAGKSKYAQCRKLIADKQDVNNHAARMFLRENLQKLKKRLKRLG